jgi:hypothetical protein
VARIEGIMKGVCPEMAAYDATAESDFQALRSAAIERRRTMEKPIRPHHHHQSQYSSTTF